MSFRPHPMQELVTTDRCCEEQNHYGRRPLEEYPSATGWLHIHAHISSITWTRWVKKEEEEGKRKKRKKYMILGEERIDGKMWKLETYVGVDMAIFYWLHIWNEKEQIKLWDDSNIVVLLNASDIFLQNNYVEDL